MEYKKTIILLALVVFLLSIAGVSASEIDNTIASENANTIGLSVDKDIIEDNLQTSEENMVFTSTDYDEAIAQTDTEVLGEGSAKYSDLAEEIRHSGNITLTHKNYTYDKGGTIIISEANKVIDGNGAVIDMNGSTIRAFHISASGVTIKNLTIKNANHNGNGGAIYFESTGTVTNCNFINNKATITASMGGAVYFYDEGSVSNCNFINNKATGDNSYGGAIFFVKTGTVTNCNFVDNTANYEGGAIRFIGSGTVTNCNFTGNTADNGGAVRMSSGTVSNCNFTNNSARYGGAIYFSSNGDVTNCNFTNNSARYGGAVYFKGNGEVTNSNFVNNTATQNGGAVYFADYSTGSIINCNFTNNKATGTGDYDGGGAVYFYGEGSVSNCNFTNNKATGTGDYDGGGAVYFYGEGSVSNCNFTNNNATRDGGAIYFYQGTGSLTNCNFTNNTASGDGGAINIYSGTVTNCNFADNTATYDGGAVWIYSGTVSNCNFTNNNATEYGGAIYFWNSGTVSNCNFTNNNATEYGGAIYFYKNGEVTDCNFTNNTASSQGGAIRFRGSGTVTNCNFTGNNATTGSAIYFYKFYSSDTLTVSNSTFLNNRANAESLDVVKNDNNITITFTGQNNLLNAIYSREDAEVAFTNVTYWGAKGITTVSATLSGSNKATGQNITVGVVVNDKLVLNDVIITNENGTIVLDIIAGENYYISARHDTDSYYTEAERTISNNTQFNVNVTSQKTTNKTVNITAKSNIPNDVVQGKLLFILSNGTQIEATYGANGTWWAEHTFDAYGEYKVNATYGLDNVAINNGTITINKVNSTITLDDIVLDYGESTNVTVTTTGATGITAKIDGNDVTVINNYNIQISGLKAGNYTLTVTTIPDDDHNPVTATSKITVNKVESTLTVDDIVFDYGSEGSGNVSFAGASEVIANVVSQPSAVVSVNGKKITVSGLAAGTYTLNVTTVPDENHTAVTETATITVNKVNSSLTLDDVELDYGESINVTVSCEGATGIDAKIDGVNVAVDAYTISISDLTAGNHTLTVATVPDENHTAVTKTATITVNKVSTNLTAAAVTATYKVNKYLIIKLTDGQGNPLANSTVTVDLNGAKNYTTDENGQIKIKVSNMVPKTYSAKISYAGNDNYIGSNATAKVVVKKATPKITASAKTFKTATKTKKYTITLKDNTGKAIKNAKVTLKVNGKTYKATTNSKGKATFKITKLTKKGTFKATITYTGNKYYNKVTKKANIKVISSWKTVSKGSKDKSTVREIQQALKNHGYYLTAYGHYLMVDGVYADCTVRSVKEFQHDKGLKVTGKVDENTAKKLGLI